MGFPEPTSEPTHMAALLIGGELYLKAADVVALLRDRAKECAEAATEEEVRAATDETGEAFMNAVAYRVTAEDYARRADWVDVAVIEALPASTSGQGS